MRLNVKRRSNADRRDQIQAAIAKTESHIDAFYKAADDDIATLDELLETQRAMRSGGSQDDYLHALRKAAESPLHMAEMIVELLDAVADQLSISSRFTVSDLGAAAVLADGAGRAALLTAEVNIALLSEADGADVKAAHAMERRRADLRQRIVDLSDDIESVTRRVLQGAST